MSQKVVIFVPGYMCSMMVDSQTGEVIWPDKVLKSSVDDRLKLLERKDLDPVGPLLLMEDPSSAGKASHLSSVCGNLVNFMIQYLDCVYTTRLDDLPKVRGNVLVGFGYDWRDNIAKSAESLRSLIDNVYLVYGPDCDIWLVAHSKGPLVCRYVIESGIAKDAAWRLKGLISLGGAHFGLPAMLSILSDQVAAAYHMTPRKFLRNAFLSQNQYQMLSRSKAHPFVYEMLPPQHTACVRQGEKIQSIYDPESPVYQMLVAPPPEGFGAIPDNFMAATALFSKLNYSSERGNRPDYYFVYGFDIDTLTMFEYDSDSKKLEMVIGDGDGMVPVHSAGFEGGWAKERFAVQGCDHAELLSDLTVLEQIIKWIV